MTAPVDTTILLPDDSGNTGKKVRTETKTVSAQTVHEHFFVPSPALTVTGHYLFSSTQQSVQIAASSPQSGTASGFFWLQNPVASTITALIRRICIDASLGAANIATAAAVISFTKFTFTGTASGATVAPLVQKTGGAVNQMIIRTATTGMSIALGPGELGSFQVPTLATAAGYLFGEKEVIPFNPFAFTRGFCLEIGPGEGLVIYQSTAGTATTDSRKFGVQVEWDELDLT